MTTADLRELRKRFYESKKDQSSKWGVIREVCENRTNNNNLWLDKLTSNNLIPVNGTMTKLLNTENFDILGVPNFCINEPSLNQDSVFIEPIDLKLILSNLENFIETEITISNKKQVKDIIQAYYNKMKIIKEKPQVSLIYEGVKLNMDKFLYSFNLGNKNKIFIIVNNIK